MFVSQNIISFSAIGLLFGMLVGLNVAISDLGSELFESVYEVKVPRLISHLQTFRVLRLSGVVFYSSLCSLFCLFVVYGGPIFSACQVS